jgi:hypothetical protein
MGGDFIDYADAKTFPEFQAFQHQEIMNINRVGAVRKRYTGCPVGGIIIIIIFDV